MKKEYIEKEYLLDSFEKELQALLSVWSMSNSFNDDQYNTLNNVIEKVKKAPYYSI